MKIAFQLTRLMRGVTYQLFVEIDLMSISTHTPHARRDLEPTPYNFKFKISTHTPHARRDKQKQIIRF